MPYTRDYDEKSMRLCDNDYLRQNFATNGSAAQSECLEYDDDFAAAATAV